MTYKGYEIYAEVRQYHRFDVDEDGRLTEWDHEFEIWDHADTYHAEKDGEDMGFAFKNIKHLKDHIDTLTE